MKKITIFMFIIFTMFSACKKKDSGGSGTTSSSSAITTSPNTQKLLGIWIAPLPVQALDGYIAKAILIENDNSVGFMDLYGSFVDGSFQPTFVQVEVGTITWTSNTVFDFTPTWSCNQSKVGSKTKYETISLSEEQMDLKSYATNISRPYQKDNSDDKDDEDADIKIGCLNQGATSVTQFTEAQPPSTQTRSLSGKNINEQIRAVAQQTSKGMSSPQ